MNMFADINRKQNLWFNNQNALLQYAYPFLVLFWNTGYKKCTLLVGVENHSSLMMTTYLYGKGAEVRFIGYTSCCLAPIAQRWALLQARFRSEPHFLHILFLHARSCSLSIWYMDYCINCNWHSSLLSELLASISASGSLKSIAIWQDLILLDWER